MSKTLYILLYRENEEKNKSNNSFRSGYIIW